MWEVTVQHNGLKAYRVVRGLTKEEAESKASLQMAAWDEQWSARVAALNAKDEKLRRPGGLEANQEVTWNRTAELERLVAEFRTILIEGLRQQPFQWSSLKDATPFALPQPQEPPPPREPVKPKYPDEPQEPNYPEELQRPKSLDEPDVDRFVPQLSMIDRILRSRRVKKTEQAERELEDARAKWSADVDQAAREFEEARAQWQSKVNELASEHEHAKTRWLADCAAIDAAFESEVEACNASHQEALKAYADDLSNWEFARTQHGSKQGEQHALIDSLYENYKKGKASAVEYFLAEVLNHSVYPESFPQGNILSFDEGNGILIVDFELPDQSALPAIKEVRNVATRQQFQADPLSNLWLMNAYEEVLCQIALRTLHELYANDESQVLRSVVLNGWAQTFDKATGLAMHACILSVQAAREEFLGINLAQVDPKECFRKLKGIVSSNLAELTPVRPILTISQQDHGFVDD